MVLFSEEGKLSIGGLQKNGDTDVKATDQVNLPRGNLLQQAAGKNGHCSTSQTNGGLTPYSTNDTRIKHSRKTKSLYEARPGTSNGSNEDKEHLRSKSVRGPRSRNEDHPITAGRTETKKEESPKRLQRIQSLARSAQHNSPTSDQDQTKRNLSRLLLQEEDSSFPSQNNLDTAVPKSNGKSPAKKSKNNDNQATNTQNLETVNESRKTESEYQTQNSKEINKPPTQEDCELSLKTSKLDQSKDNGEQNKVLREKINTFKDEKKASRHRDFGSFDIIESDESETVNAHSENSSDTLEPGSQKEAIASYLFSGLHTQLVPFYVGSANQERIQAHNPHIPENQSQGSATSKKQKEDRHRIAQSVEYDDRVNGATGKYEDNLSHGDVKEKINRIERASSEPPEIEKDFFRRKGPPSERSFTSDQTPSEASQLTASESKFQPEELKSRMADTSMTTDSGDQDLYVTQLREVILQNTVVYFSNLNQNHSQFFQVSNHALHYLYCLISGL